MMCAYGERWFHVFMMPCVGISNFTIAHVATRQAGQEREDRKEGRGENYTAAENMRWMHPNPRKRYGMETARFMIYLTGEWCTPPCVCISYVHTSTSICVEQ